MWPVRPYVPRGRDRDGRRKPGEREIPGRLLDLLHLRAELPGEGRRRPSFQESQTHGLVTSDEEARFVQEIGNLGDH